MKAGEFAEDVFCAQSNGCPLTGWRGDILLTVENNTITRQRLLRPDERVMSLNDFIELARSAGWSVTPWPDTTED